MTTTRKLSRDQQVAMNIVKELCKPENIDLFIKIKQQGSGSTEDSFMFGFQHVEPITFDEYVHLENLIHFELKPALGIETDEVYLGNMSEKYDAYLARNDEENAARPLSKSQSDRFEEIISPFDDGWSGAYYGFLMRWVQTFCCDMKIN